MPLNVNKLRINADDSLKNTIVNKTGIDDSKCIPDTINRIIDEAGSGEGAEYTGGTGISVDNSSHTITNTLPGISYNGKDGINVSGSDISAKIDGTTIKLNSQGQMTAVNEGKIYQNGTGIEVDNTNNKINAKIDGTTIKINEEGKMYAEGGSEGKIYEGGPGIEVDNQNDKINAKVDGVTVGVNSDNQLQAEKYEINITSKSGGEGKTYTGGDGIEVDNANDTISAKINDATMEFVDGKLSAKASEGKTYNSGDGINVDNTNNKISAKIDGTTITLNSQGQMTAVGGGSSGVSSVNSMDGAITIAQGNGIGITSSNKTVTITNTSPGQTYDETYIKGIDGIVLEGGKDAGNNYKYGNVTIKNSGVRSFNGNTGAVTGVSSFNGNTGAVSYSYSLPKATASSLGGVMVDNSSITISNTGVISSHAGSYSAGKGIGISSSTISAHTYIVEKTTGKGCTLSSSSGSWRYGQVANITKYGSLYIDIVEVTADNSGHWGQLSYNVYTNNSTTITVYPWAYQTGAGNVTHTMIYLYTLYASTTNMTPLEMQYENEKFEYLFGDPYVRATRYNMYIHNKQDIIISKSEQSFSLEQYIPDIYYSGQEGDVHKVSLKDCKISPYNTNEVGIQKIDIKYIGEHNHYEDKESIGPASIYLKVEE